MLGIEGQRRAARAAKFTKPFTGAKHLAHFYGTTQAAPFSDNPGSVVSRTATKRQGIRSTARSYEGVIDVQLWADEATGQDQVTIRVLPHYEAVLTMTRTPYVIYTGPIGALVADPLYALERHEARQAKAAE